MSSIEIDLPQSGGGSGTVTSVTASSPLASSGGTTPNISLTGTVPIANGGTGVTSVTTAPTATSFAGWDANGNLSANDFLTGYATTVSANGTTTLTASSAGIQFFTGTQNQSVNMPVTSTMTLGQTYRLVNLSTGILQVQTSVGAAIQLSVPQGYEVVITCILLSGNLASSWSYAYYPLNFMDLAGTYLPLTGGTMSGQINMGANNLTGLNNLVGDSGPIGISPGLSSGGNSDSFGHFDIINSGLTLTWDNSFGQIVYGGGGSLSDDGLGSINVNGAFNDSSAITSVDPTQRVLRDNGGSQAVFVWDDGSQNAVMNPSGHFIVNSILNVNAGVSISGGITADTLTLSGTITNYAGINTVNSGVASEIAHVDLTNQTAAITNHTLYAVPTTSHYRVSYSAQIITAASTSSVLGGATGFCLQYNNPSNVTNVQESFTYPEISSGNSTATAISGVRYAYAASGNNITFNFGYTSVGATAMKYNIHTTVEKM